MPETVMTLALDGAAVAAGVLERCTQSIDRILGAGYATAHPALLEQVFGAAFGAATETAAFTTARVALARIATAHEWCPGTPAGKLDQVIALARDALTKLS